MSNMNDYSAPSPVSITVPPPQHGKDKTTSEDHTANLPKRGHAITRAQKRENSNEHFQSSKEALGFRMTRKRAAHIGHFVRCLRDTGDFFIIERRDEGFSDLQRIGGEL